MKIMELVDYDSLVTVIERKEFEDAAAAFFEKVIAPVEEVL